MNGFAASTSGWPRLRHWLREHAPELLFACLLLAVLPMRDLWAPDEPDFAQCVKEMRLRGDWLLPWLNGQPYSEKPILFYWVMKSSALLMDTLTGGLGFTQGVAAWALRLPTVLASVAFLAAFRRWAVRFLEPGVAEPAALILATTPIWFWQSQFIQIDLLFAALLAWSWLCWLGGYLLLGEQVPEARPGEARRWFLAAYVWLALAFLAKGPLAPVLSVLLLVSFLLWQRDFAVLRRTAILPGLGLTILLVAPWYVAAGLKGGAHYAYELIVMQNFERATRAWDHIHPWWKYGDFLLGDFFPWVLLLPALCLHQLKARPGAAPAQRFLGLAFGVPLLFLSLVQSKQGKYLLMGYPFLALLLGGMLAELDAKRARRLGTLLAGAILLVALALATLALGGGGSKIQLQVAPYLAPLRLMALFAVGGGIGLAVQVWRGRGQGLVPWTALSLGLIYLVGGTWGFHRLDPRKNYRRWTETVQPLIQGRQTFYWQTMRSGVMVYTDHLMPEIRRAEALETLDAEARLVAQKDEWEQNAWGMNPERRARFEILCSVPTGGGEILLLRRKTS